MADFLNSELKLPVRLNRLRRTQNIRNLVQETYLVASELIYPLFINENISSPVPIKSMPGQMQFSLESLPQEIELISKLGINTVLLFGIPGQKDDYASASLKDNGIIQQAIRKIKEVNPDLTIIADVCLCEYTNHGHCGVLENNNINNDKTLEILTSQALSFATAGVDWVAPSSMTDGMVQAIRLALDKADFKDVAILSYAVKYASSFYSPFREAAQGAPLFGDRRKHQMNIANINEALREASLDVMEGADLLMIKPAMNYLDVICKIKNKFPQIPLCAYQVSGEYSMLKIAANAGVINEKEAMLESLMAIKRAGSDAIITYFAKDAARILNARNQF